MFKVKGTLERPGEKTIARYQRRQRERKEAEEDIEE